MLVVLVELFRETPPARRDDPLLKLLNEAAHLLAGQRRTGARTDPASACSTCWWTAPEPNRSWRPCSSTSPRWPRIRVVEKLWEEVALTHEPGPRALLLGLLMELDRDARRLPRLCDEVLNEMLRGEHDELVVQKLGHNLIALGETAVRALSRRYEQADNTGRTRLTAFLDTAAQDERLPVALRAALVRQLVESLKMADRRLRMEILRSRILNQAHLAADLKASLADELLALLRAADSDEVAMQTALMLGSAGRSRGEGPVAHREIAARLARGRPRHPLAGAHPGREPRRGPTRRRPGPAYSTSRSTACGGPATARAATHTRWVCWPPPVLAGKDGALQAFHLLAEGLPRGACPAETVEALGLLAASEHVTAQQRVQAVHLLTGLVDRARGRGRDDHAPGGNGRRHGLRDRGGSGF